MCSNLQTVKHWNCQMSVNKFLLFLPVPTYFLLSFQMTENENRKKLEQETLHSNFDKDETW